MTEAECDIRRDGEEEGASTVTRLVPFLVVGCLLRMWLQVSTIPGDRRIPVPQELPFTTPTTMLVSLLANLPPNGMLLFWVVVGERGERGEREGEREERGEREGEREERGERERERGKKGRERGKGPPLGHYK